MAGQLLYEEPDPGAQPGARAVAGYLFGLCGELALKEMMRESGMRPLPEAERRDDPFYLHFPAIKARLEECASGRRAGTLRQLATEPRLFQYWDTSMRYAPTREIEARHIAAWKADAERLVAELAL
jgi:hypothetical protein